MQQRRSQRRKDATFRIRTTDVGDEDDKADGVYEERAVSTSSDQEINDGVMSSSSDTLDFDTSDVEDDLQGKSTKRGRKLTPTKRAPLQKKPKRQEKTTKSISAYKKLSEYTVCGDGPFNIYQWSSFISQARPMKRGVRRGKSESLTKFLRPPTDLLRLCQGWEGLAAETRSMPNLNPKNGYFGSTIRQISINDGEFIERFDLASPSKPVFDRHGMTFISCGSGPVCALSFSSPLMAGSLKQFLAVSCHPSTEYRDLIKLLRQSCDEIGQIQIWLIDWTVDGPIAELVRTIESPFGIVRQVEWLENWLLIAAFADGTIQLFRMESRSRSWVTLDLGEGQAALTCFDIKYSRSNGELLVVSGTSLGDLTVWKMSLTDETPNPIVILSVKVFGTLSQGTGRRLPVTAVSFCHGQPGLVLVTGWASQVCLVDLHDPYGPLGGVHVCFSTLSKTRAWIVFIFLLIDLITNSAYAAAEDLILFCDNEVSIRALVPPSSHARKSEGNGNAQTFPIGTFDAQVMDAAGSPFHNVLACVGCGGELHLVIIDRSTQRIVSCLSNVQLNWFSLMKEPYGPLTVLMHIYKSVPIIHLHLYLHPRHTASYHQPLG